MVNWMKKAGNGFSEEDEENLFYFKKSIREKRWYRKEKKGEWEKSFRLDVNFPEDFEVCKILS
jgi:hypothetical protein